MTLARRAARGLVAIAALSLAGCPKPPVEAVVEHWCPEGFEVGHGDVCFALPATHGPATGIVVYLHGKMEGRGDAEEWATARAAVARGFAVVLPRGRRGLCAWKPGQENQFCWPHDGSDHDDTKVVVADWDHTLWQVNELLEGGRHPRYVLGFAQGARFAAHLAQRGAFKADGFALVSGELVAEPATTTERPPAIMLTSARESEPAVVEGAERLGALFAKEGRPHERCVRPGERSLTSADVDAALRFFQHRALPAVFACDGAGRPPSSPEKAGRR